MRVDLASIRAVCVRCFFRGVFSGSGTRENVLFIVTYSLISSLWYVRGAFSGNDISSTTHAAVVSGGKSASTFDGNTIHHCSQGGFWVQVTCPVKYKGPRVTGGCLLCTPTIG